MLLIEATFIFIINSHIQSNTDACTLNIPVCFPVSLNASTILSPLVRTHSLTQNAGHMLGLAGLDGGGGGGGGQTAAPRSG